MEKRLLIAFVLSAVIFAVWSVIFPPPKPVTVQPADTVPTAVGVESTDDAPPAQPGYSEKVVADASEPGEDVAPVVDVRQAENEETRHLSNDVVDIELSNRGAAITSLLLRGYSGDDDEILDLVQSVDNEARALPLQLVVDGRPDTRLYEVEAITDGLRFMWSDGAGATVEKEVRLAGDGYGIEVNVAAGGALTNAELAVGTGMRNTGVTERQNRFSTWGDVVVFAGGESEDYRREKQKERLLLEPLNLEYAGFSDTYFLSVFFPSEGVDSVLIEPLVYPETNAEGEVEEIKVLQVRLGSEDGQWQGRLFSAPKEYDLLQAQGGGLEKVLDFGIFHPISVFFLKALRWIFGVVGNYGWAIVLLTLGIRIVLFPLMHTSTVSMRRMQKLQPKVKAIQEKYKKNKSDPQVRAKMNQEMMALYKEEGVNPMGGCLPVLVQLPILWALYTLFAHAIELRHAPFIFWIEDLSAKDPIYITPVLMTLTMWLQQKLAPQAGDPQQQKIFRMMPFIFGIMFLGFPSGLVLYWLSNNVITILQQEVTLRLIGERGKSGGAPKSGKGKKK